MISRTFSRLFSPALAAWTLIWLTLGDRTGLLALLNAFAFWGLLKSLLVPLWAGSWAVLAALPAAVALATRYRPILVPARPQSPSPDPRSPTRLLTFNLLKTDRDLAPVFAMLERENPDIAVFQEVTPALAARLEAGLADRYPFRHWQPYAPTRMGLGMASRLPFAVADLLAHPGLEPFALGATVITPSGPLTIYTVQLVSPTNEVRGLGLTPLLRLRTEQAQRVFAALDASPHPALAVGDWNSTEGSDLYREAVRRFTDAWTTGGRPIWRGMSGWPGTWPTTANPFADVAIPPLLRLDYAFLTPGLTATHVHVVRDRLGSDHCPVVVELGIGDWGLGIRGLGIGDQGSVSIPNPQSPIPNPYSPTYTPRFSAGSRAAIWCIISSPRASSASRLAWPRKDLSRIRGPKGFPTRMITVVRRQRFRLPRICSVPTRATGSTRSGLCTAKKAAPGRAGIKAGLSREAWPATPWICFPWAMVSCNSGSTPPSGKTPTHSPAARASRAVRGHPVHLPPPDGDLAIDAHKLAQIPVGLALRGRQKAGIAGQKEAQQGRLEQAEMVADHQQGFILGHMLQPFHAQTQGKPGKSPGQPDQHGAEDGVEQAHGWVL